MSAAPRSIIVVPCHDEERRLDVAEFARFLASEGAAALWFVDDGSRDGTAAVLEALCARFPERARLLRLPSNRGKAEAVRHGILASLEEPVDFVGFWDADLATPLAEFAAFLEEFAQRPELEMVFGSRVLMLGRRIERRVLRHYVGRVFATIVSWILRLPVYDTQCGAKLFRATPTLAQIFATPFTSRWVFDVEILARLSLERARGGGRPTSRCVSELPLHAWRDVVGSKIGPGDFTTVARDLWRIYSRYGKQIRRLGRDRSRARPA